MTHSCTLTTEYTRILGQWVSCDKIKKERRSQRDEDCWLDIETNLDDAYASYLEYMKLKYGKSSNLTDDVFTEEDFLDKSE